MPPTDSTPTALTISAPRPPRKAPDPTAPITPLDPPGILAQLLDPESFETLHAIAAQHKLTLKELADRLEDDLDTLHRLVHVAHLRTAFMASHAEHIALAALTQIAMVPLEDTSPRRLETVRRASTTITTISKRWTPILAAPSAPPHPDAPAPPPNPTPPPSPSPENTDTPPAPAAEPTDAAASPTTPATPEPPTADRTHRPPPPPHRARRRAHPSPTSHIKHRHRADSAPQPRAHSPPQH